jgi:glucosamine--fructose-6-phosphate aminotransferase (isomerizing)
VSEAGPTILERELREQGAVLAARAPAGAGAAQDAAALIARDDVDVVLIAARGSSDNAARFGQYLLGLETQRLTALATPWLYDGPPEQPRPRLRGVAAIGISQSGRSPDIVAVLAAARAQGRPTIAITNDERSPLAEQADVIVPLGAGEERSVAATKTYLASLHALVQIVDALAPDPERTAWLDRLPELVEAEVVQQLDTRDRFRPIHGLELTTVVGRGLCFATALETALKLRELTGVPAEGFSPPDLLHGPVAALSKRGASWIVSAGRRDAAEAHELLPTLLERTAVTVVVADDDALLRGDDVIAVRLPQGAPDWVGAALAVIPAQAAALFLAQLRGVEVDHPHGLAKVTLTR